MAAKKKTAAKKAVENAKSWKSSLIGLALIGLGIAADVYTPPSAVPESGQTTATAAATIAGLKLIIGTGAKKDE